MKRLFSRGPKIALVTKADRARDAGHWDIAARYYREELDKSPNRASIWIQYGHALKEMGLLEEAEAAYRQAALINPEDPDAYIHLGHTLVIRNKITEAKANYLHAFMLDPAQSDPLDGLRAIGWAEHQIDALHYLSTRSSPEYRPEEPTEDHPALFCVDGPFIDKDTLGYYGSGLLIFGWAILPNTSYKLRVYLDGLVVGEITPSYARVDICETFPSVPESKLTGFDQTLALPVDQLDSVAERRIRVTLMHRGALKSEVMYALRRTNPYVRIQLDDPALYHGKLICESQNAYFSGWIVAQVAVTGVLLTIGTGSACHVQYGHTRSDVSIRYPGNPNGMNIGFSTLIASIPSGCSTATITVMMAGGLQSIRTYDLEVTPVANPISPFRRLSYAKQLYLARQGSSRTRSYCCVMVAAEHECQPAQHAALLRTTMLSIQRTRTELQGSTILLTGSAGLADTCRAFTQIDVVENGNALAERLSLEDGAWLTFLRAGDVLSPNLHAFLNQAEYDDNHLIYWDEIRSCQGVEHTFLKVPGAPFITLLHSDMIGLGWAARVSPRIIEIIRLGNAATLGQELPLQIFAEQRLCRHIPEVLSLHLSEANKAELSSGEIAARNAVLRAQKLNYGSLILEGSILRFEDQHAWPKVSVIIPRSGTREQILGLIYQLKVVTDYPELEVIILSHVPDLEEATSLTGSIADIANKVLRVSRDVGWARGCNTGAAAATGDIVLFLDASAQVVDPSWLRHLVPYLSLEYVGSIGPRILSSSTVVQSCGVSLRPGRHGVNYDYSETRHDSSFGGGINQMPHDCSSLPGMALMIRRAVFIDIGGLDEHLPSELSELDFHLRLRQNGLQAVINPRASLLCRDPLPSARGKDLTSYGTYWDRWHRQHLMGDPFIHPALETESGKYTVEAEPARVIWSTNIAGQRKNIRKILAIRIDHIGDFVTTIPALNRLRQQFPNASIDIVVGRWNREIAASLRIFGSIMILDYYKERSGDGINIDRHAARRALRDMMAGHSYDLAIDFRLDGDTRFLLTEIDAHFRSGFSQGTAYPWLDISLEWEGNLRLWHKNANVADLLCRLVSLLEDRFPDGPIQDSSYWGTTSDSYENHPQLAAYKGTHRVVLHPFPGHPVKTWSHHKWVDLVRLLVEDGNCVLVVGSPIDAGDNAELIKEMISNGAINAVGLYNLTDLANLLRYTDCFIGCDSGPKHIAAAAGIPVVSIQSGFVDPTMWGPMNVSGISLVKRVACAPCYINTLSECPRSLACMTGIEVRDVYIQAEARIAMQAAIRLRLSDHRVILT